MSSTAAGPSRLVVVDKADGLASADIVARVRLLIGTHKVGRAPNLPLDRRRPSCSCSASHRPKSIFASLILTEKAYDATVPPRGGGHDRRRRG